MRTEFVNIEDTQSIQDRIVPERTLVPVRCVSREGSIRVRAFKSLDAYAARAILLLISLLLSTGAFAGQSAVFTATTPAISVADPVAAQNQPWRVEFQVHNWTLPPAGTQSETFFYFAGLGAVAYFYPDGSMATGSSRDTVVEQQPCFVKTTGLTNVLVRLQRDVANMQITCELWNYDGTAYTSQVDHIKTLGTSSFGGGTIGGAGLTASIGFLRVFSTAIPLGSRPPATADVGDYVNFPLDGNLNDTGARARNGSGTLTYVATPNQVPIALPKTLNAPSWSNAVSLRAGFPAQLDGSASYSMADGDSSVTYLWQQLSGPSTLIWKNRDKAQPTITGLIFGDYTFRLQVTDVKGNKANATLEAGAVATDANGVVVNANPAADALFGPMIAFGKNPWGWADARNLAMENLQKNTYATPPTWSSPAENHPVTYRYFGITSPLTTLSADLSPTATTIPVVNAATIDLSALPTEILVGSLLGPEIVRICSAAGNVLNVCYDGRAFHAGHSLDKGPSAWPAGAGIWQARVHGAGTHFLTTICRFGAGYTVAANSTITSAGSVVLTAGSALVTGTGVVWDGTQNSLVIAVNATHGGGVPFTFLASVVSAAGTALTLSRPYPADADGGAFSYNIFSDQRNIVLNYTRTDSAPGSIYFTTAGCESDTDLYLDGGWDNSYAGQLVSASPYSYMDGFGYVGDFSPNYYDMGLAHYAFYFRSGLRQALTSARSIEDYWIHYPEIAEGEAGGIPRRESITGVYAATLLDGDRASNWPGLRSYAKAGVTVAQANNCDDDPRETAYELSWLALAAQFDPDPAQRQQWQTAMASAYSRDNGCKGTDNSYPSGFYWNPGQFPPVIATSGSLQLTPASGTFPPNMCYGVASGTAIATNGSAMLTGVTGSFVLPAGSNQLIVGGTRMGNRYDLAAQFDFNSPNSVTMSALWPGDSGVVYWTIQNNNDTQLVTTIATGQSDSANFGQIFGCTETDSTHILLHRPWPGSSGTYNFYSSNLVGRGTQPFMMGIKTLQERFGAQAFAPYKSLDEGVANWVGTVGFDVALKAISYGRGFPQCEPLLTDSGITDVGYRNANCVENSNDPIAVSVARARNSEAQNSMTVNYLAHPTAANQLLGDQFYGGTFGASGYTAPGYFSDGISASNLDDVSLGAYKWPGFFFGVGMAHQWPAARVGGVAPPKNRTVYVSFNPGAAASARVVLTAPSGANTSWQCGSTSPCAVTVDDRQGSYWFRIQYLSESGRVVAQSDPDLLAAAE